MSLPDLSDSISFEFATAARILFGPGRAAEIGPLARALGQRALVVTGSQPDRAQPILDSLAASGVRSETFPVASEPTTVHVATGVALARQKAVDLVIGFGGGSAIDTAKAIAGLITHDQDLFEFLEIIGRGKSLTQPALPWIAVPTTAGAGAEVTRNAVLTSREHRVKASLRSPHLLARIALIDPELCFGLPRSVTAATGLDALTQLIEPFVCRRPTAMIGPWCRDGIRRIARSLRRAMDDGGDLAARTDMALAALFGGLALTHAGLGAVHGLAAPLGGALPAPHGAVCAALLPHVIRANLHALRERDPHSKAFRRYDLVARDLTGRPDAHADDAILWVQNLVLSAGIPPLRTYGLTPDRFEGLAEKALAASSMKANPVDLRRDEVVRILQAAW